MIKLIHKYLERNGKIIFENDTINGVKIIRIKYSNEFWINEMNFLEWLLMEILDECSGFYGYRKTIKY